MNPSSLPKLNRPESPIFERLPLDRLPLDVVELWERLVRDESVYASPFFSRTYSQLVESVGHKVVVGVERDQQGAAKVILPLQLGNCGYASAPSGAYADYQGPLIVPGYEWNPGKMLKALGIRAYDFQQIACPPVETCSLFTKALRSYSIQLPFTRSTPKEARKLRSLQSRHGLVEFIEHSSDAEDLKRLTAWKVDQCRRTGFPNILAPRWVNDLLKQVLLTDAPDLQGVLSVLRVGGKTIAANLGLRNAHVWHSWFTAYDTTMSSFSPGWLLLREILSAAGRKEISLFDFGPGEEAFKIRWSDCSNRVGHGSFTTTPAMYINRKVVNFAYRFRGTAVYRSARSAVRHWRRCRCRIADVD